MRRAKIRKRGGRKILVVRGRDLYQVIAQEIAAASGEPRIYGPARRLTAEERAQYEAELLRRGGDHG